MIRPAFFDDVRKIALRDPLAEFLGAAEGGVIEYGYLDAVKLAGHSCPTVAAAYLMTLNALTHLYGDELPERGAVRVLFRDDMTSPTGRGGGMSRAFSPGRLGRAASRGSAGASTGAVCWSLARTSRATFASSAWTAGAAWMRRFGPKSFRRRRR